MGWTMATSHLSDGQRLHAARAALIRGAAALTEEPTTARLADAMLHAMVALVHLRAVDADGAALAMAESEVERRKRHVDGG